MYEGVEWIGGESSPPTQGDLDVLWYMWAVDSSNPCEECVSRDGTSSPVIRPQHAHCSCNQEEDWRVCFFQARQLVLSSTQIEKISVGQIEPGDSASFTRGESDSLGFGLGFKGLSGSVSYNSSTNSRYNYENDGQEIIDIYELWQINTDTYIDTFDCLGSSENEQVEVRRVETIFMGYSDSSAEMEVTVVIE